MKRVKEWVGTHEFLQVLPVLPVETPIGFPDPVPSWIVPRPGRKEDDGIVRFNLEATMQFVGDTVRSIIGEDGDHTSEVGEVRQTSHGNGRGGIMKDHRDGARNRRGDAEGEQGGIQVSVLVARVTLM